MTESNVTEGPPASEGGADKEASDRYEIYATILLGLATVAIAFAAYQASLWGGVQDTNLTDSVRASNDAVDAYQLGDSTRTYDQTLFVEFAVQANAITSDEEAVFFMSEEGIGEFILANMSPAGRQSTEEWFFDEEAELPFLDEAYEESLYSSGRDLDVISEDFFQVAAEANKNGDDYTLASTILASVLFFSGISIVLASRRLRLLLILGSALLFLGAAAFTVSLPRTF